MARVLYFFLLLLLLVASNVKASEREDECPLTHQITWNIGAVTDYNSRVGKEQKIAMEMAVQDFHRHRHRHRLTCSSKLVLHFNDSHGNSPQATSSGKLKFCSLLLTSKCIKPVTYKPQLLAMFLFFLFQKRTVYCCRFLKQVIYLHARLISQKPGT